MTVDEYDSAIRAWLATSKHPTLGRPYTALVYQPQLELLDYLRANGFKTFIVSGGTIEFMRVFAEQVYGITPEQVIGSSQLVKYVVRDGKPALVREPKLDFVDDGPGKPSASTGTSAESPCSHSATRTATCRCCNTRPRRTGRISN